MVKEGPDLLYNLAASLFFKVQGYLCQQFIESLWLQHWTAQSHFAVLRKSAQCLLLSKTAFKDFILLVGDLRGFLFQNKLDISLPLYFIISVSSSSQSRKISESIVQSLSQQISSKGSEDRRSEDRKCEPMVSFS